VSKDGGPAFGEYSSMTLRDYFAGMAMQGLFAQSNDAVLTAIASERDPDEQMHDTYAEMAYLAADAMLAERKK